MANIRIFIDPGHGGNDSGAVHGKRKESDDVLKLGLAVGKGLEKKYSNVTMAYSRKSDMYEKPSKKAQDGNNFNADYFFSFHRNCANGKAKGYETEYKTHSKVKDGIMNDMNKKMKALGFIIRGNVQRDGLAVLNQTSMPALLFEGGFIDNSTDNKLFDEHFNEIVNAYVEVIGKWCGLKKKTTSSSTKKSKPFAVGNYNSNVIITKDKAIVRNGRGKDFKKIGVLKKGDKAKALYIAKSKAGNLWASIDFGKDIGYICLNNAKPV